MWRPCFALLLLALLALDATAQGEAANTRNATADQERATLTALLSVSESAFEKAKACQRLAVIGDASSVPAISPLLLDPELSGYARTALEQIPSKAASEALVVAINQLRGQDAGEALDAEQRERLLIGLLHSLGRRSDGASQPLLIEIAAAEGASAAVRETAARALENLEASAAAAPAVAPPADLAKLLQSDDPRTFRHALQQVRQQGKAAAAVLMEQLPQLSPPRQTVVLLALADLGDRSVLSAVEPLTQSEHDEVAATAWETMISLGGLGDSADRATAVFETAMTRPQIASRLLLALADAEQTNIDSQVRTALRELAESQSTREPAVAMGLFEYAIARPLDGVTEPLLQIARSHPDAEVAAAAIRAAGSLATVGELTALLAASDQLSQRAPDGPLALAAAEAVQRATVRMPPAEVAEVIAGLLENAEGAQKAKLMEQLAYVGGERALEVVAGLAQSSDLADVDLATRVLGQWLSTDAASVLGGLADSLDHPAYRLRALRGYLRIGRQFDMPAEQRTELATRAYQLASRDEERMLALEILERFPTPEGLTWLANTSGGNRQLNEPQRQAIHRVLLQVARQIAHEQPQRFVVVLQEIDLQQLPELIQSDLRQLTEPAGTR